MAGLVPAIRVITQRAVDRKDVDARNIWREDALSLAHDETLPCLSIAAIIQRAVSREPGKSSAAFNRTKSRRGGLLGGSRAATVCGTGVARRR